MENIFIYENANSLPKETCEMIVNYYEEEGPNRYEGIVLSGVHKEIKDTLDFIIPNNNNRTWERINAMLIKELKRNLKQYLNNFIIQYQLNICNVDNIFIEPFLIQRYIKCVGKYVYHNDFDKRDTEYRLLTYLWYLNDVNEGGETEFFGKFKIKPEIGKLVIFPANWTFPHCGKMPVSNDKYILTGWLYVDANDKAVRDKTSYNINTNTEMTPTEMTPTEMIIQTSTVNTQTEMVIQTSNVYAHIVIKNTNFHIWHRLGDCRIQYNLIILISLLLRIIWWIYTRVYKSN